MNCLDKFDFKLISTPDFNEDDVREEIITPVLKEIGYSLKGKKILERGKRLRHPFLYIGTSKRNVTIIPDYILSYNNRPILIIDAKSPSVDISTKKVFEQIYSYAIHPEIDSHYYCVCNGHQFVVFDRSKIEPRIFHCNSRKDLLDLAYHIDRIESDTPNTNKREEDIGLKMFKSGIKNDFVFMPKGHVACIALVSNEKYLIVLIDRFGQKVDEMNYSSFFLNKAHLHFFMEMLPGGIKSDVKESLSLTPFSHFFDSGQVVLNFFGEQQHEYDIEWSNIYFLPFECLYLDEQEHEELKNNYVSDLLSRWNEAK